MVEIQVSEQRLGGFCEDLPIILYMQLPGLKVGLLGSDPSPEGFFRMSVMQIRKDLTCNLTARK